MNDFFFFSQNDLIVIFTPAALVLLALYTIALFRFKKGSFIRCTLIASALAGIFVFHLHETLHTPIKFAKVSYYKRLVD